MRISDWSSDVCSSDLSGGTHWLLAVVLGALLPSLVALLVVFPLKGMAFAAHWDPKIWVGAALLNGAWGCGVALLMQWLGRRLVPPTRVGSGSTGATARCR